MKNPFARLTPWILAALLAVPPAGAATKAVSLEVDGRAGGVELPSGALGLSYETSLLSPNAEGVRYFRPDNQALLKVFRTLGVKNLRIGGNSVDDPKLPLPSLDDVRALFRFARKAGVKVIYSVRLQNGEPASAEEFAKLIHREFPEELESFALGNEPSYYKDYAVYSPKWAAIRDAILRGFPGANFCGPDQNPDAELVARMVRDFGAPQGRLVQITQHSYPFGCSYKNPRDGWKDVKALIPFDAAESRKKMLWEPPYATYEQILAGMKAAVAGTPVTFRLTETNSFWFSGLAGASDSYASALWAVDYLHWWVSRGAAGLNFHTGDRTGGSVSLPCRYAAFVSAGRGYEIRPLGYGLKLFSLMGTGRYVELKATGAAATGYSAYAVKEKNKLRILVINRGDLGEDLAVIVRAAGSGAFKGARQIDLTSRTVMTEVGAGTPLLGGAEIAPDGSWSGRWTKLGRAQVHGDQVTMAVPALGASLVEITLD